MRKILNLLLASITMLTLSGCPSSADPDDAPDNPNTPTNPGINMGKKKLSEMKFYFKDDDGEEICDFIIEFAYDKKGNVSEIRSMEVSDADLDIYRYEYEYENNVLKSIICTSEWYTQYYTIENDRITEYIISDEEDILNSLSYVNEYLSKITTDDHSNTYLWNNGKLLSTKHEYLRDDYYYRSNHVLKYDGETCKGFFPFIVNYIDSDDYLFCAMPQLIGASTIHLPSEDNFNNSEGDESKIKFIYDFYPNGYLKKMTSMSYDEEAGEWVNDGDGSIEFVWE